MKRKTSPLLVALGALFLVLAGFFGDDVPVLNEIAALFDEVLGTSGPQVVGLQGPAEVTRVSDGDTLRVELDGREESVRLIGVDTPEKFKSDKLERDAEESPLSETEIQALGEEASAYAERLLGGQEVYLELGTEERDRYGRILAYVYVRDPEGDWTFRGERFAQVNLELARAGWADPLTIPPNVAYAERYVEAAREAREANLGMWREGWVSLP